MGECQKRCHPKNGQIKNRINKIKTEHVAPLYTHHVVLRCWSHVRSSHENRPLCPTAATPPQASMDCHYDTIIMLSEIRTHGGLGRLPTACRRFALAGPSSKVASPWNVHNPGGDLFSLDWWSASHCCPPVLCGLCFAVLCACVGVWVVFGVFAWRSLDLSSLSWKKLYDVILNTMSS